MPQSYPGWDGFLPWRGSFMIDLVLVSLGIVLVMLAWSLYQVKRRRYALHKRLQLVLCATLAVVVTLFEIDMRIHGWQERARPSPYYGTGEEWGLVSIVLAIHLVFAVTTVFLWIWVTVRALRRFPAPPHPGPHSPSHRLWARIAVVDMLGTIVTGAVFYWLAFVAS